VLKFVMTVQHVHQFGLTCRFGFFERLESPRDHLIVARSGGGDPSSSAAPLALHPPCDTFGFRGCEGRTHFGDSGARIIISRATTTTDAAAPATEPVATAPACCTRHRLAVIVASSRCVICIVVHPHVAMVRMVVSVGRSSSASFLLLQPLQFLAF
jgi:hypothetical protein